MLNTKPAFVFALLVPFFCSRDASGGAKEKRRERDTRRMFQTGQ
jgi:hypothetical protein